MPFLTRPALAVDLPGRGNTPGDLDSLTVEQCAASVLRDADRAGFERFELVGHSLGGLTISAVAARAPSRVSRLVFVSCAVPPEGGSAIDTLPVAIRWLSRQALKRAARGKKAGHQPGLSEKRIRAMFCNDMNPEQTRFVIENCGPEAVGLISERVSRTGIPPSLPKTYVRLLRDASLPPKKQDELIANLRKSPGGDVEVIELDSGHDAMISHPAELAAIIDRL
ncbi:MAG: putative esterase [Actinomycetia bacterium]|nr:putative esterase [Actinomycetes bacterium]